MQSDANEIDFLRLTKNYINHQQLLSSANFIPTFSDQTIIKITRARKETSYKAQTSFYDLYSINQKEPTGTQKINPFPLQDFPYEAQSISPRTAKYTLKIRKLEEKIYIEVWNQNGMIDVIDASSKFEFIYNDAVFGGLLWSENEESVLFVAEKKRPKPLTLAELNLDPTSESLAKDVANYLKSAEEPENFGENLEKKIEPEIWHFDIPSKKLSKILNVDYENLYPACPIFYKNEGIIYNAIEKGHRKLGLSACMNRPQGIYFAQKIKREEPNSAQNKDQKAEPASPPKKPELTPEEAPIKLTGEFYVALRPLLNSTGNRLVFLSAREKFCEHLTAFDLSLIEMDKLVAQDDKSKPKIINIVPRIKENLEHFNGVFSFHEMLILNGFVSGPNGSDLFVLQTIHRGRLVIVVYDIDKRGAKILSDGCEQSSYMILDTHPVHGLVYFTAGVNQLKVAKYASYQDLASLPFLNQITDKNYPAFIKPLCLYDLYKDELQNMDAPLNSFCQTIMGATGHLIKLGSPAEAMLFLPPQSQAEGTSLAKQKLPLVVVIHGGPHGTGFYVPGRSFDGGLFLQSNYAVLVPNFRGSAGYGLDFLRGTVGAAGTGEVEDVIALINRTLELFGDRIDEARIAATGFSYGGFLSCWLAAHPLFSKRLKTSVPINAVTFLPEMLSTSDIPDWCFAEALGSRGELNYAFGEEELLGLFRSSPLRLVGNVSCPVLVVIGQNDMRVPPSNGRLFYRALKSLGKPDVELLSYKGEGHKLGGFEAETHLLISILRWLKKYL